MSNIPNLSGKRLIKILTRLGFEVARIKGSHHFLRHADSRTTAILDKTKEATGKEWLRKILADCGLTIEDIL